jgi:hypothetical protein
VVLVFALVVLAQLVEEILALLERNVPLLMELMEVCMLMIEQEYEELLLDIPKYSLD